MANDDLTLWDIDQGIAETSEALEEAFAAPQPDTVEIARLQEALKAYVAAEVRKVDGVRGYIKHAEMMAAAAREEARAQSARAQSWQMRLDRVKALVGDVMRAAGARKYESRIGFLRIQANGGKPSLEIAQPMFVPPEYKTCDVRLTAAEMGRIVMLLPLGDELAIKLSLAHERAEPNATKIRIAIEAGEQVPGCYLNDKGEHLRVG